MHAAAITIGTGGTTLRPMMWMFLAILATFLITRTVTRLIRSGSGGGVGLGNVRIGGTHVHHQVAVPACPDRKLVPPMSAPVITSTQKIASTDCRPSLVQ